MAEQPKTTVVQQQPQQPSGRDDSPKSAEEANRKTGGDTGTKAPAAGTDQRPAGQVQHQDLRTPTPPNPVYDKVEKGKLGDTGPSSDASGKNQGNMREEEEQHPSQNAVAGGPNVGITPSAEPGMSHS